MVAPPAPDAREPEAREPEASALQPYEVFRQEREGDAMRHGGSVLAPDATLALHYARELFGRRQESVRLWVDGPNRSPADVDSGLRASVEEMVLRSYEMQNGAWEDGADEEDVLDPPVGERLGEVRCPTLVLVGEHDVADMQAIAALLAGSIRGARLETIAGAAHLPSLERPAEVDAFLLDFLGDG